MLCKTYDEKFTSIDDFLSFHIYNKNKEVTFEKISNIYENVKSKYDEVFEKNDKIKLDKNSVFYIVHQLQNIYFTSSERNVLSDAFETIIGNSLKGSQGQFFTPKNVLN